MKASKQQHTLLPAWKIKQLTGWDNNTMRFIRKYDLVYHVTSNDQTIRYSLESAMEYLQKTKQPA